jgi:hypothetical protein
MFGKLAALSVCVCVGEETFGFQIKFFRPARESFSTASELCCVAGDDKSQIELITKSD